MSIHDGDAVVVASSVGSVTVPAALTDRIMPGVASKRPGVNTNLLSPAGTLDPLSGNATLTAIPVEVTPAGT